MSSDNYPDDPPPEDSLTDNRTEFVEHLEQRQEHFTDKIEEIRQRRRIYKNKLRSLLTFSSIISGLSMYLLGSGTLSINNLAIFSIFTIIFGVIAFASAAGIAQVALSDILEIHALRQD